MLKENLIKLYQESFRNNRELPALTDYFKKETFSYFEMAKEIAKLHLLFKACNVEKGDKIALVGRNNPRWCIAYIATITYGAVIVPILQDFNSNDIHHIINHSDSVLLFAGDGKWDAVDTDNTENLRAAFSLTDFRCLYQANGSDIKEFCEDINQHYRETYNKGFSADNIIYPEIGNDEVAVISYTSGTTGFSKGVMQTVNNLTGNVMLGIRTNLHYRSSRALSFLPLAHAYGCAFDFLLPLAVGSHITLLGKIPTPKVLVEAAAEVKPNLVCSVPLLVEKIYRKQIKPNLEKGIVKYAMRVPLLDTKIHTAIREKLMNAFGGNFDQIIIGGAPLNAEVEAFLYKIKFPFTVGYGMTECSPLISYIKYNEFIPTSCGQVLEGLMIAKIDSPDPVNIPGEIRVKGEHVTKGYYKNPSATEELFDQDGWLRTGDMGTLDHNNMLFIKGRCKTLFLSPSGQNIYPEAIESKLNNMNCVMESLIVEREGKLVALVYPDYDQTDTNNIPQSNMQEIMNDNLRHLNSMLASFEQVSSIVLYPNEFEKTPKKSIKRYLYNV